MPPRDVEQHLSAHFGAGATLARHHNHAGAGKLLFRVSTGASDLWVKVAADADEDACLRRWLDLASRLESQHAAPPVIDSLQVHGRLGLVFPYLRTPVATRAVVRSRVTDILALLDGLHHDDALAARLRPETTAAQAFGEVWLRRLQADLEVVRGRVPGAEQARMARWLDDLAARITGPAFEVTVGAPVHADPWHENLLIDDADLWLLDWEDLRIGDPVIDRAIVLHDAFGPDVQSWGRVDDDEAGHRLRVAADALLLDEVIDGAADFVENTDPRVKAAKRRAYRDAMRTYAGRLGRPRSD